MKSTIRLIGNLTRAANAAKVPLVIIALVAVIGFSMVACGGDGDGGGGSGAGLTIIGLSDYNGQYATAKNSSSADPYLLAGKEIYTFGNSIKEGVLIAGGSVTLKVWKYGDKGNTVYSGNDQNITFKVKVGSSSSSSGTEVGTVTVNFSGGKATGTFIANP